jgi:hypothetical protein
MRTAGLGDDALDEKGQSVSLAQIPPIDGGVLRNQDDLKYALLYEMLCIGHDVRDRATTRGSSDGRNGAESTSRTASVGDLEIGTAPLHCNPTGPHRGMRWIIPWVLNDLKGSIRPVQPFRDLQNVHPTAGTQYPVQMGH